MSTIWVCKNDGKIQCDNDSKAVSLDEMRKEIEKLVGKDNVLAQEKQTSIVITLCGTPAGGLNAYELTQEGYDKLQTGFVGPSGFIKCIHGSNEAKIHGHLDDLIGHSLRRYNIGDSLTEDYRPERFNIGLTKEGLIGEVWFG